MFELEASGQARNEALAGYLARADWSPENLGHHLNRLAVSLRLPDRLHEKTPRRWVEAIGPKTRPSVPRDPWPGLVCTVLSRRLREPVTLADLGWQLPNRAVFVPADDGLELAWDAHGAVAPLTRRPPGEPLAWRLNECTTCSRHARAWRPTSTTLIQRR